MAIYINIVHLMPINNNNLHIFDDYYFFKSNAYSIWN